MNHILTIQSINPCIRKVGIEGKRINLGPKRFIYDYEFIYCHKGRMAVIYDDHIDECFDGHMLIIPPKVFHQLDSRDIIETYWVHFDLTDSIDQEALSLFIENQEISKTYPLDYTRHFIRGQALFVPNKRLPSIYSVINPINTLSIFLSLYKIYTSKDNKWFLQCKTYLCQLLLETLDHLKEDSSFLRDQRFLVMDIKRYLESHNHRLVTSDELSGEFHYHRDTLNRIFKQETGETLGSYSQNLRHSKLKTLLSTTTLSLENIAELCGYTDRSHLIRSFKKNEGISPNEYRTINILTTK
ncbi:helix-turn-helix transcriptional regulator [Clostridium grantii]|uniref:AraC-type DNA-binding protein n=1 Tax=Clostridium grantii DSM 8605 TaxID=1121316 RepID=A0A1M5SZE6_9CLOT|nr:AraC family transcriptional regulator [Clostridium grantii]SHH43874.1 AraC-type DNA-binding protein [Clostridium grantii DSM 8605]